MFADVRRRLVETGTRNRLVHVNRASSRGNVLNIVNERSDEVFKLLSAGKALRFKALGRDKTESPDEIVLADTDDKSIGDERYTDNYLESRLGPDSLQKKLLKLHREAQTAEEESGVNILYLALGFLTWFEDKTASVPREAPLVLLPVELVRNARTSTFDLRLREEDFPTNLPLQQRLKSDFGINLPDIEVAEDWCPTRYFDQVQDLIEQRDRWTIDRDGIQLGFFSFSKLLMYRDLDARSWPEDALTDHELTRGLLYEGFDNDTPMFGPDDRLDEVLPPERLFHVVDADASQAKVIEEVRSGRNLVVQGPPGTGKSQTITNIIAAAVKDGKRVLFVAEKMAALSVVHDRLVKVGLRDVCLELHSRSANKKSVLAELAYTLNAGLAVPGVPGPPTALREARDRLNQLAEELHRPIGDTGESGFSVLGRQSRFLGMGAPPPTLDGTSFISISREDEAAIADDIRQYVDFVAEMGGSPHPFEGVQNLDIQPVELSRLQPELSGASAIVEELLALVRDLKVELKLDFPETFGSLPALRDHLGRLGELPGNSAGIAVSMLGVADFDRLCEGLEAGGAWKEIRDERVETFVDHAFETPVARLRGPLAAGAESFFARWGRAYRGASRELAGLLKRALPKTAPDRIELVDQILDVGARKRAWDHDQEYLSRCLDDEWRGEQTDFAGLLTIARWCQRLSDSALSHDSVASLGLAKEPGRLSDLRQQIASVEQAAITAVTRGFDQLQFNPIALGGTTVEDIPLPAIATRLKLMSDTTERYGLWAKVSRLRSRLAGQKLSALTERIDAGELTADAAITEFRFARAEALWRLAIAQSEPLRNLALEKRHDLVANFAALERERLSENVTEVLAGHLAQVPQGAMGEMRVIRGEIGKKRGHIALRRLFERAGNAIQRIKPVLLMSPISVAQFLPPGTLTFDLLVIDEASQVRPEDALGAIARVGQIVVVGDKKQLPPSSFFDRLISEEEEAETPSRENDEDLLGGAAKLGALESVLTLCEARGLGSRMLSWHYRSRDPSLIEVSNREFYESGLILPPSPLQRDPAYGLCFNRVDGVYDKGGKRDNRKEGEAIVARVAEHARENPTLSLGIVTFSFAQRNLITELLELARRSDPVLDGFLREGQSEDVFVKNIENVQGDERDVILISVGYGPAVPGGKLTSMTFGPVNSEGGERRLNVLFTRARARCEIFTSFEPGDIDLSRTSGEGPRILKRFLEFAKSGYIHEQSLTGLDADTPFEEDVADVIRSFGYLADAQVGSAGFRVDLGVRHPDRPGRYILAVECDGSTYHSALWARERDRLRQDVLEHLGWQFHRIWSTDWFYQRAQEIERLRIALTAAHEANDAGIRLTGANLPQHGSAEVTFAPAIIEVPEIVARQMPFYQRAQCARKYGEPHEAHPWLLSQLALEIVEAEGPIHLEEVGRRIASSFGKEKAGSRIIGATARALSSAMMRASHLRSEENFYFTDGQAAAPPVRDRSKESGATLKASSISMLEIREALRIAREDNAGGDDAELIRTAAKLLGFKRVGPDLQARLKAALVKTS
ncbi:MAG: DUF3320 domain-containing protein [Sphingomonas sp.]|nr:DUF3320 domain-containing protein [Sphingomonas sp.]